MFRSGVATPSPAESYIVIIIPEVEGSCSEMNLLKDGMYLIGYICAVCGENGPARD